MNPGKPPRKLRNLLLDKRFQLKYTLAVVFISAAISVLLGTFLYRAQQDAHQAQKDVYQAQRENSQLLSMDDPEMNTAIQAALAKEDGKIQEMNRKLEQQDRQVLIYLVVFLGGLVLALTILGIVATHKIAGPAYAMRRTLSAIADGRLPTARPLRHGDELQAVADELLRMISMLREREERELQALRKMVEQMKANPQTALQTLTPIEGIIQDKATRLS